MISKISPQDMINPNFFIIPIQDMRMIYFIGI